MAPKVAVSPLAPKTIPVLPPVEGVRFATAAAGIRYQGRTDVMLALFDKGTQVAGVFTRSKCPSAPVDWCRSKLKGGKARALVVNSGNANAFTGKNGFQQAKLTADFAAKATGAPLGEIFLASDRRDRRTARRPQVRRLARRSRPPARRPTAWSRPPRRS